MNEDTTSNRKLWIDTDAGTDDAIALMVAITHPSTDIVGISTVGGNVSLDCVIQNVLFINELFGTSIPVYRGSNQPLSRVLGTADFIHGKDGLGDIGLPLHGRKCHSGDAVDTMIEAIMALDGKLDLIMLGPLTNLAKAIQRQPAIIHQVNHLYVMGGLISGPGNVTPHAEYNIWADPEAAQIVLAQDMSMTTIGWDTTERAGYFTLEDIEELRSIGTEKARIAADMQMVRVRWQIANGHSPNVTWADPTAMISTLYPESIVHTEMVSWSVRGGTDDDPYRGYVEVNITGENKIKHITDIDRGLFKSIIMNAVQ